MVDQNTSCSADLAEEGTGDNSAKVVIDASSIHELANRHKKATPVVMLEIAAKASRNVKRPYIDHGDLLYDDQGLPK